MATKEKMIVALIVLFAGLMLTGCGSSVANGRRSKTYPYSKLENDVYNYIDKLSKKIPKGFTKTAEPQNHDRASFHGQVIYFVSDMVRTGGDEPQPSGKGGNVVLADFRDLFQSLLAGQVDGSFFYWLEGQEGKAPDGSSAFKVFASFDWHDEDNREWTIFCLAEPDGLVAYCRRELENGGMAEWRRLEVDGSILFSDLNQWKLYKKAMEMGTPIVSAEHVRRYRDLANRLNESYFKDELQTQVYYINSNNQRNEGNTGGSPSQPHTEWTYMMKCMNCGKTYETYGGDVHDRKCPFCQGGKPGLKR